MHWARVYSTIAGNVTVLRLAAIALLFAVSPARASAFDCSAQQSPINAAVTITLDAGTAWQPRGGQVRVKVESQTLSLENIDITACFRWAGTDDKKYLAPVTVQLIEAKSIKAPSSAVYAVTVPEGLKRLDSSWFDRLFGRLWQSWPVVAGQFDAALIVPMADLRFVVTGGELQTPADVTNIVGITSVWNALIVSFIAVVVALLALSIMAAIRKVPGRWPLMCLISTRQGYASLSQFQIILWSFLFGAGGVYVMVLSGSLIDVPARALILLGISGATTIGSKIQSANESAGAPPAPANPPMPAGPPNAVTGLAVSSQSDDGMALRWTAPAAGAPVTSYRIEYCRRGTANWASAGATGGGTSFRVTGLRPGVEYTFQVFAVNAAGSSPAAAVDGQTLAERVADRAPQWSDLVVTPTHPGEIDVTRVQMLFFTLISAGFVGIKLFNSYMIPDIPDGFMLLMGISNGVYLSAKFVPDSSSR